MHSCVQLRHPSGARLTSGLDSKASSQSSPLWFAFAFGPVKLLFNGAIFRGTYVQARYRNDPADPPRRRTHLSADVSPFCFGRPLPPQAHSPLPL